MSNYIKDLYDYDLVKKCSKCKTISLKSNYLKILLKRMVIDRPANGARINFIMIIKIE